MKSMCMRRWGAAGVVLAWLGLLGGVPAQLMAQEAKPKPAEVAPPKMENLDILNDVTTTDNGTPEAIEAAYRLEKGENSEGDKKPFTIQTRDDLKGMKVGDLYKNEDTLFKVTAVHPKAKGGSFEVSRIVGMSDPQRRWIRLAGAGPTVVSSTLSLFDLYLQGGIFLHPIAFLFVVMVVLTVNGAMVYRRKRLFPEEYVAAAENALVAGDLKKFEELAKSNSGLLATMCRAMMTRFDTSTVEEMRMTTEGAAMAYIYRLRVPIRAMNLIAVAAPLLGLLGTIIGMVIVFEGVAGSSGAAKASVLASGIRVKLFSTASALIVAIPALFIFFIFNQKLNLLVAECNNIAERFSQLLSRLKPKTAGESKIRRAGGGAEASEG